MFRDSQISCSANDCFLVSFWSHEKSRLNSVFEQTIPHFSTGNVTTLRPDDFFLSATLGSASAYFIMSFQSPASSFDSLHCRVFGFPGTHGRQRGKGKQNYQYNNRVILRALVQIFSILTTGKQEQYMVEG